MKYLYIVTLLVFSLKSFSQNSNEIKYSNGDLYMISNDKKTREEIFNKPIGKVEFVIFNTFYKSYTIAYNYKGKGLTFMEFEYLKDIDSGTKLMKEKTYGNFYVIDKIKENGILIMTNTEVQKSDFGDSLFTLKINNINK
ncbi:hypothetical protein [Tenacibaculum maritimum]|uniref:hypothetical protein n=1 Tax=Tenacibaculum maritimum TaxID=107401 RepID=UPI0012E63358|nr:hypothetical protein [Tenacibaculum maritimum]CAA0239809.1 conserved hypothetical protein [Tenacibaculum maritimum]